MPSWRRLQNTSTSGPGGSPAGTRRTLAFILCYQQIVVAISVAKPLLPMDGDLVRIVFVFVVWGGNNKNISSFDKLAAVKEHDEENVSSR